MRIKGYSTVRGTYSDIPTAGGSRRSFSRAMLLTELKNPWARRLPQQGLTPPGIAPAYGAPGRSLLSIRKVWIHV